MDPADGEITASLDVAAHAGTAFDGRFLYQLAADRIHKIDPKNGEIVSSIPAPGVGQDSGLAWAEGSLWVGQYDGRRIQQVDPVSGQVLRILEVDAFVTGVAWVNDELWHATWDNEASELRRVDAQTGELLERLELPEGMGVTGLEAAGTDRFYCGGGRSGKVRAIRRPE